MPPVPGDDVPCYPAGPDLWPVSASTWAVVLLLLAENCVPVVASGDVNGRDCSRDWPSASGRMPAR